MGKHRACPFLTADIASTIITISAKSVGKKDDQVNERAEVNGIICLLFASRGRLFIFHIARRDNLRAVRYTL